MRAALSARLLIATLGLLACATCVFAEGAWALWGQTQDPWGALETVRLGDGLSREACEQERASREKEQSAPRTASYACLPASMDPRRPKGSDE
jgi:hypothetical protein